MKSLVAKNAHGMRGSHSTNTRKAKILAANRSKWIEVGKAYAKEIDPRTDRPRGEEQGALLTQALIYSEQDYSYGCKFLFGVQPFPWQRQFNDGLDAKRLGIVRLPNAGGKTTDFTLRYLYRGFFRVGADPMWGQYRMFHFTPQESQGMETKIKIDEILGSRAREQAYEDTDGNVHFRRCFAARWIKQQKFQNHEGFTFFNGGSTLEFAPTAFMGMGKDGTDPMFIGLDEARHERNLTHLVQRIWIPRFLRTPGSRLAIEYTPMEASPELEMLLEHAQASHNWYALVPQGGLRKVNKTLHEADIKLAEEELDPQTLKMVTKGEAIQPRNAKFNMGAVKASFVGTEEPPYLSRLTGLRRRVEARCSRCVRGLEGHPADHMMLAFLDPASSATDGDSIVFEAWDIDAEPPHKPIVVEFLYEVQRTGAKDGPETIQKVGAFAKALAREIRGPFGYDAKSALGHNVADHIVELEDEGVEVVEVRWNSEEEKDRALDKVGALLDGGYIEQPFHRKRRSQLISYVRKDRHIAQDFVMVMAVGAEVAWPYLPDFITDPDTEKKYKKAIEHTTVYDAISFGEGYNDPQPVGPDPAWMPVMAGAAEPFDGATAKLSVALHPKTGPQRGFARA